MTTSAQTTRAAAIPDRPSIDGLEDKWTQVWEEQGTYAFDREPGPVRPPRGGLRHRHPAAHGVGLAAHGPRLLLHAHRLHRPLQADGRASRSSTRSAGTTTACPPSAGCRTTTASAATRRLPYDPDFVPPHEGGDGQEHQGRRPGADLARRTSSSCATSSRSRTRRPSRRSSAGSGCLRLADQLPHHRRPLPRHRPAGLPAQPRPRRGVPGRGARAVGRHVPDRRGPGRARGPRLPRRTTTASRSTGTRRRPGASSRRPAPS